MKSLYIMRHAKAAQHHTAPTDFERVLTERGEREAYEMALRLYQKNQSLDLIISSPAARTKRTSEILAEAMKMNLAEIHYNKSIYESTIETITKIVSELNNVYNTIMLVGHNPTLTYMVEHYSQKRLDNLPTAGMYLIEFDTNNWEETANGNGELIWVDWPKL
jgi:phosphohistidine phosphatase